MGLISPKRLESFEVWESGKAWYRDSKNVQLAGEKKKGRETAEKKERRATALDRAGEVVCKINNLLLP